MKLYERENKSIAFFHTENAFAENHTLCEWNIHTNYYTPIEIVIDRVGEINNDLYIYAYSPDNGVKIYTSKELTT